MKFKKSNLFLLSSFFLIGCLQKEQKLGKASTKMYKGDYSVNSPLHCLIIEKLAWEEQSANLKEEDKEFILKNLIYFNALDEAGNSPLMLACSMLRKQHFIDFTKFLIENGANLFIVNSITNETVLHICVARSKMELLDFILENKAKYTELFNKIDNFGKTALYSACEKEAWNIAEKLIPVTEVDHLPKKGLDPILILALKANKIDIFKKLLEKSKLMYERELLSKNDKTMLQIACENMNLEAVKLILENVERGKRLSKSILNQGNYFPPLFIATFYTTFNAEITKCLVIAGADLNLADAEKRTVLHYITGNFRYYSDDNLKQLTEILEIMIKSGLDPNLYDAKDELAIYTLLDQYRVDKKANFLKILELLLKNTKELKRVFAKLLEVSLKIGDVDIFDMISMHYKYSFTNIELILEILIKFECSDVPIELLDKIVSRLDLIFRNGSGQTLLHIFTINDKKSLIDSLFRAINPAVLTEFINIKDNFGNTALHYVKSKEVADILLMNRAV